MNRGGVALVVWATQESAAEGRQLFSRRLDPVAGWTGAERIDGGEARRASTAYAPSLALDDAGNGLAVWDSEGVVAARLVGRAGWLAPERIAGPPSSVPKVFLDAGGRGFAAWTLRGEAYARRFEPAGGWGETTRFTPEAGWSFSGWGDLAFDSAGQALLVWWQTQGSVGPDRVWSAAYAGGRWSAGVVVSTGATRAFNPRVGVDGSGVGTAAWNESQAGIASARWERGAWGAAAARGQRALGGSRPAGGERRGRRDGRVAGERRERPRPRLRRPPCRGILGIAGGAPGLGQSVRRSDGGDRPMRQCRGHLV